MNFNHTKARKRRRGKRPMSASQFRKLKKELKKIEKRTNHELDVLRAGTTPHLNNGQIPNVVGFRKPKAKYDQDDCRYCLNRREVFSQISKEWTQCPRCQA